MPYPETQLGRDITGVEVLTLSEAAAFLRSTEEAVVELVETNVIPAQRIGGDWRFLKRALVEFLRFGSHSTRDFKTFPPLWMLEHHFWEEMFWALEQRILSKLPSTDGPLAKPGTPQAVLKHFGVFKDDDDVDEQLAGIRARREATGE